MSTVNRISLLIVHDDPIASAGLSVAFSLYSDFEVLKLDDFLEGETLLLPAPGRPAVDVVVADYRHGVALAAAATGKVNAATFPKIVVVAGSDREWDIRSALQSGVRGYLLAGCGLEELASCVRTVQRGARHLSPAVAQRLAESLSGEPLTAREQDVLNLVVEGLCNKEIARQLGITVGTVKSHLKSAFAKLNVGSRTQAVAALERRGVLCGPATAPRGAAGIDPSPWRALQASQAPAEQHA